MIVTIATVFSLLSIVASVLFLSAMMLSLQIRQQTQLIEATIIVQKSQLNTADPYSLEN
jgi:cell division protein FtsL